MNANIPNLILLRDWLVENKDNVKLHMMYYRMESLDSGCSTSFISKTDCGTVGCLLGWAPTVDGLEPVKEDYMTSYEELGRILNFPRYSKRVFGINLQTSLGDFLFSSAWTGINNTAEGAVKRLTYIIDNFNTLKYFNNFEYSSEIDGMVLYPNDTHIRDWVDPNSKIGLKIDRIIQIEEGKWENSLKIR